MHMASQSNTGDAKTADLLSAPPLSVKFINFIISERYVQSRILRRLRHQDVLKLRDGFPNGHDPIPDRDRKPTVSC